MRLLQLWRQWIHSRRNCLPSHLDMIAVVPYGTGRIPKTAVLYRCRICRVLREVIFDGFYTPDKLTDKTTTEKPK